MRILIELEEIRRFPPFREDYEAPEDFLIMNEPSILDIMKENWQTFFL